jgi:hypothetical protein
MRLNKVISLTQGNTSDLAGKSAKQLVKLLPYTAEHEQFYGPASEGGAYSMYADQYGEQSYEMRANGINPGTFKQWLIRQVGRSRYVRS